MPSTIRAITRTVEGIGFSLMTPEGVAYGFNLTEETAGDFASRLLDAVAGRGEVSLRAEIAAIRRDQQQIVTALQEVARKVARHEAMAKTDVVTIRKTAGVGMTEAMHINAPITVSGAGNVETARLIGGEVRAAIAKIRDHDEIEAILADIRRKEAALQARAYRQETGE